jgi:hypothetical protein
VDDEANDDVDVDVDDDVDVDVDECDDHRMKQLALARYSLSRRHRLQCQQHRLRKN